MSVSECLGQMGLSCHWHVKCTSSITFQILAVFQKRAFWPPLIRQRLTCRNTAQHLMWKLFELKVWPANRKDILQGLSHKRMGTLTCNHCSRWKTCSDQQGPYFASTEIDGYSQLLLEEATMTNTGPLDPDVALIRPSCQDKRQPPEPRHGNARLMSWLQVNRTPSSCFW